MKLQLFVEDKELDLTGTETFPLNKTFDNLNNPTDIIVEYSKSINVPITLNNNRILGNSYRLDREIVVNNTTNIGMYLDPNKRIPMKLIYNNEVVLDGYAKFVSSTQSLKNNYYTLNLFGVLGDIFHKLKNVVVSYDNVDESLDNPEQYVLNDYSLDAYGEPVPFDNAFVSDSWDRNTSDLSHPSEVSVRNIYGAAPTYCGYYPNFEPTRVQWSDTQSSLIEDELRETWKQKYYAANNITNPTTAQEEAAEAYVDALDPAGYVGDGLKDYQIGDYRAYKQRPFIYFNKLLYMFKDKLEELSDYALDLDSNWFNANNPYWAHMCYMFDHLQKVDGESSTDVNLIDASNISETQALSYSGTSYVWFKKMVTMPITGSTTTTGLVTNPFNLCLDLKLDKSLKTIDYDYDQSNRPPILRLYNRVGIKIDITCGATTHTFYSSGSSLKYVKDNPNTWLPIWDKPTDDNYLALSLAPDNMVEGWSNKTDIDEWFYYLNIPALAFEGDFAPNDDLTINIYFGNTKVHGTKSASFFHGSHRDDVVGVNVFIDGEDPTLYTDDVAGNLRVNALPITYKKPWYNVNIGLKTFYKKEDPLFNVILEYTKMFGLVWSVDYQERKVRLQRRETLFNNYQIEDWSSKLDKTQDMVVEPVSFPSQYIRFGYEDTDGYRYTSYKDSYDVEYGDKIVKTAYEFNSDDTNMIEGIKPTIASNRNFVSYMDSLHWDTVSTIKAKTDFVPRLECADEDDKQAISAGNWCMRSDNIGTTDISKKCYITNDTPLMLAEDKSYYIDPRAIEAGYLEYPTVITHYGLPVFTPVFRDSNPSFSTYNTHYSCLFNTPYEDFTSDKLFLNSKGRTIYDLCWNKFINERYNAQNKKVTAFFNLTVSDYNSFNFNKFITFDNQLFMVNKIMDFNPTTNKSTKCELIQIADTNNYTQPLEEFEPIMVNLDNYTYSDEYSAYLIEHYDGYVGFNLVARAFPDVSLDIDIKYADGSYDEYMIWVEDTEHIGDNTMSFYINCPLADYGVHDADFDIILTSGSNTLTIPFALRYR